MKRLSLLLLGAGLLLGCRESDDLLLVCAPDNSAGLEVFRDFIRRNGVPEQVFALNLGQPQTLETNGGARIELPANAFLLPNGAPASGQAELRVRELYSVPDMMLTNQPSGDNGLTLLVSGGQFKLQVWQGATRLRLRPTDTLRLTSPVPTPRDSTLLTGLTTWRLPLPDYRWLNTGLPVTPPAALAGQRFYQSRLPADSLSWWGINRQWNADPGAANTTAEFSYDTDGAGSTLTHVWVLPAGLNAVFPTYNSNSTVVGGPINLAALPKVPVGSRLTAVVLQIRANGLYFGTRPATVQHNQVNHVALTRLSEAEIVRRIRQL